MCIKAKPFGPFYSIQGSQPNLLGINKFKKKCRTYLSSVNSDNPPVNRVMRASGTLKYKDQSGAYCVFSFVHVSRAISQQI